VVGVVDVMNNSKSHFAEVGVSRRDIHNLAQQIDGEFLHRQRNGFEAGRFEVAKGKKLRKSQFRAD
jgi:hypothetical protein